MTRAACLMMQKDEDLLLRPWLLYHGDLFGYENLYVLDNGSTDPAVLETLRTFEALGVHVDDEYSAPADAARRGELIGARIRAFAEADLYDVVVPAEVDAFLARRAPEGLTCEAAPILSGLAAIAAGGVAGRIVHNLENWPGYADLFRYLVHPGCVVPVRGFVDLNNEFTSAGVPEGREPAQSDLIFLRLGSKPYARRQAEARRRLAAYVDVDDRAALAAYAGPDAGVKLYLLQSEEEYSAGSAVVGFPFVRFAGFRHRLAALAGEDFLEAWEAGRAPALPRGTFVIDLDALGFSPKDYAAANPGLPGGDFDLFGHFIGCGIVEGRPAGTSADAPEEVVARLAALRACRSNGVDGYRGLASALQRAKRLEEGEEILARVIEEEGPSKTLLSEYAVLAMHRNDLAKAADRWADYRENFPDDGTGYDLGATVLWRSGKLEACGQVLREGLERFPDALPLLIQQLDLHVSQGNWQSVSTEWPELARRAPDHYRIKALASAVAYGLREWQSVAGNRAAVEELDAPVAVDLSHDEAQRALDLLHLADLAQLREFFMLFENVGYNCEFGLVQRHFGAEPLGLLRWVSLPDASLVKGLESRFEGFADRKNLEIRPAKSGNYLENYLYNTAYNSGMHTFVYQHAIDPETFLAKQAKRMQFLRRKFLEDLGSGEKVVVRLEADRLSAAELQNLRRQFRRYGDCRVLYVRPAEGEERVGTIEPAGEGMLVGYLSHKGQGPTGWNVAFDEWLAICRAAATEWNLFDRLAEATRPRKSGRPHGQSQAHRRARR